MNCESFRTRSRIVILISLFAALLCFAPLALAENLKSPSPGETTLRIGLIPEQNIFDQKKRYAPLLDHLSEQLGVTFEIVALPRYGNILDNFNSLRLDGAFFGSFTGALAIKKLDVQPIARPLYEGGASTYFGLVFVKKNSGIKTAADLKGKRMVFVDRATTAGYLLPRSYFQSLGIADYSNWFSETYYSGTHEDAILDVLSGVADIGAAKNTVFYRMATSDNRILDELEILTVSPHVPSNGLALKKGFPANLKQQLQTVLLSLHETESGRQVLASLKMEKFIRTTAEDYKPVMDYAESIGLDLATYDYQNN
jgi:phosphonate transport system substrate-binding protein